MGNDRVYGANAEHHSLALSEVKARQKYGSTIALVPGVAP